MIFHETLPQLYRGRSWTACSADVGPFLKIFSSKLQIVVVEYFTRSFYNKYIYLPTKWLRNTNGQKPSKCSPPCPINVKSSEKPPSHGWLMPSAQHVKRFRKKEKNMNRIFHSSRKLDIFSVSFAVGLISAFSKMQSRENSWVGETVSSQIWPEITLQ